MKRIPHQLMELNSTFIWHWPWFIQGVKSAKQHGFTGIILHQQELLSFLATPSPLSQKLNVENLIHQQNYGLQYLKRVDQYLAENNLSFWLQGEAAPSDDIIKRKFPELTFDEKSSPDFWQQSLHDVWSLLRAQGKKLVLRDYIDDSWPRQQLSNLLATLPDDVRASIKATELDYHPGFANHPHIATLPGHKKWIEYDLFGTGYGWTALPCYLADEISGRLSWALSAAENEIEAVTSRVSWQWLPDSRVMDSANAVNLFGLSAANQTAEESQPSAFERWAENQQLGFRSTQDKHQLSAIMHASYDWLCKTPNFLGRRLHYQSQIPESVAQAQQLLHMDTRSANWMHAWQPLMPTDDAVLGKEQRERVALEKEAACFLASRTVQNLRELMPRITCPNDSLEILLAAWRSAEIYSQMFSRVAAAMTDILWIDHYGPQNLPADVLQKHQQQLLRFTDTLDRWLMNPPASGPLFLPLLLSPQRLARFANSLNHSL